MGFTPKNFKRASANAWTYETVDPVADVLSVGYFNHAAAYLSLLAGDTISVTTRAPGGTSNLALSVATMIPNTVVSESTTPDNPASPLSRTQMAVRCEEVSDYAAWTAWSGRKPDFVHAFGFGYTTGSYSNNIAPFTSCLDKVKELCAKWPDQPLAWALPLSTNSQSLTEVAAGTHDMVFNQMIDAILSHNPTGGMIPVRIGHEPDLPNGWPWRCTSASGPGDYVPAFQRVAALFHSASSRFKIDFCVSAHSFDYTGTEINPLDPTTGFYPGNTAVDVIGMDFYVVGADVSAAVTFPRAYRGAHLLNRSGFVYGLQNKVDFAIANNKRISVPEWGVGSDRPDYIRDTTNWMYSLGDLLLYHGYWNKNAGASPPGPYPFPCSLTPDGGNDYPLAKAAMLDALHGDGTAYKEQSETPAYFARGATAPTAARRAAVDRLITTLKFYGLLGPVDRTPALDGLYLLAAHAQDLSCVGVNLAGGWTTTVPIATGRLGVFGSPSFVPDRGWAGNGVDGELRTGLSLTTSSPAGRFVQNSAHMGLWSLTGTPPGAQQFECGNNTSSIGMNTSGTWVGRPNAASTVSLSGSGAGPGHVLWNRTASTAWASYFNGTASQSGATASAALTATALRICSVPEASSYGSQRLAIVHWGRALSVAEVGWLYAALQTYLQDIGAV